MGHGLLNPPDPAIALSRAAVGAVRGAVSDEQADLRVRQAGLTVLRRNGDPSVLAYEIAMLKEPNEDVRRTAAEAMIFTKDPAAVLPLVAALGDGSESVGEAAKKALPWTMKSLGNARNAAAVPVLISAFANPDPDVRKGAAGALGEIGDAAAAAVLDRAAEKNDIEVVAAAYAYFIRQGRSETEPLLIRALESLGDAEMAKDFMNCGNARLSEAGRKWRVAYGLDTDPLRPALVTVRWGTKRP
jgi:HEAT repeat protein